MTRMAALLFVVIFSSPVSAQIKTVQVTEHSYALVGPLGQRGPQNLADNATFGVVVTAKGVILIDAGGTYRGAAKLDAAIRKITDQPVVVVINTGGQDQRWLGNSYWAKRGARIIASTDAVADQRDRESLELSSLEQLVGNTGLSGTEPTYASETFTDRLDLSVGGVTLKLYHLPGGAHTPGDSFVWFPAESVMFSGDIVYVKRLLVISRGLSDSRAWLASFRAIAAFKPDHLVPGHGPATDMQTATADTYDYIVNLRARMAKYVAAGGGIIGSVNVAQSKFAYLKNFKQLAKRNAQAMFEAMEWE